MRGEEKEENYNFDLEEQSPSCSPEGGSGAFQKKKRSGGSSIEGVKGQLA